jgi:hypothetical protein
MSYQPLTSKRAKVRMNIYVNGRLAKVKIMPNRRVYQTHRDKSWRMFIDCHKERVRITQIGPNSFEYDRHIVTDESTPIDSLVANLRRETNAAS